MRLVIFILFIFLLGGSACSPSNVQKGTAKYYKNSNPKQQQTILGALPLHTVQYASFNTDAPQTPVTDVLYTDPCEDEPVTYTYTSGADKEKEIKSSINRCTLLPGPWIATFATFNGQSMPSIIRPNTTPSEYIPLNIYYDSEYDEPITLLVAREAIELLNNVGTAGQHDKQP